MDNLTHHLTPRKDEDYSLQFRGVGGDKGFKLSLHRPLHIIIMKTSKTHIVHALRQLWLRSVERSEALKREGYCCEDCHVKQCRAKGKEQKIQVHHVHGIGNWDKVIEVIREQILCDPTHLQVLCPDCHKLKD